MSIHKHILLPTDLTEASNCAAAKARALADLSGAKISVLHIVDYLPPKYIAAQLPAKFGTESALVERAREHLVEWTKTAKIGDCDQIVEVGSPKRIIVDTARDRGIDLIIMGSHGDRGLARIIGSTARGVLHDAPCDVLVVHLD